jgi:hypothetical protein
MNENSQDKNKQGSNLQEDKNNPNFAKSPSGFPEEPRATKKDEQQAPGSNPGDRPDEKPQPMSAPGKKAGLSNEEDDITEDENNPTRRNTNPGNDHDPTNPDGAKPGKHSEDRDGQQEKETEMPETPPSEWDIKGGQGKPGDSKQPNNNDSTQDKQHRGL